RYHSLLLEIFRVLNFGIKFRTRSSLATVLVVSNLNAAAQSAANNDNQYILLIHLFDFSKPH
ncbi:MAG: hypothetical protein H6Q13_3488, partial [Bacteroidetes bacterium]|nr:hypothetical protein [Bacteroidota bacterium]